MCTDQYSSGSLPRSFKLERQLISYGFQTRCAVWLTQNRGSILADQVEQCDEKGE